MAQFSTGMWLWHVRFACSQGSGKGYGRAGLKTYVVRCLVMYATSDWS